MPAPNEDVTPYELALKRRHEAKKNAIMRKNKLKAMTLLQNEFY